MTDTCEHWEGNADCEGVRVAAGCDVCDPDGVLYAAALAGRPRRPPSPTPPRAICPEDGASTCRAAPGECCMVLPDDDYEPAEPDQGVCPVCGAPTEALCIHGQRLLDAIRFPRPAARPGQHRSGDVTPEEIRQQVDGMAPRVHEDGAINARHVAIEQTLRTRYGHPSYIADLDGPDKYRPAPAPGGRTRDAREQIARVRALADELVSEADDSDAPGHLLDAAARIRRALDGDP